MAPIYTGAEAATARVGVSAKAAGRGQIPERNLASLPGTGHSVESPCVGVFSVVTETSAGEIQEVAIGPFVQAQAWGSTVHAAWPPSWPT
jgi:hypothetical protein